MTLPDERTRALINTRDFLRRLLDPKLTPKVPRAVRDEAYRCLRHFPWNLHIDDAAESVPDVFGPTPKERDDE